MGFFKNIIGRKTKETKKEEKKTTKRSGSIMFALFIRIAEASGKITKEHMEVIDEILVNDLKVNQEEKELVIRYIESIKDSRFTFEEFCTVINDEFNADETETMKLIKKMYIIDKLYMICSANKNLTDEQNRLINFAISLFNVDEEKVEEIKKSYFAS